MPNFTAGTPDGGLSDYPRLQAITLWYDNFVGQEGRIPTRREIDPLLIPEALGYQMISELHRDRKDARIRMAGTIVEEFTGFGEKSTGKWYSDLLEDSSRLDAVRAGEKALDDGKPLFGFTDYVRQDGVRIGYARLICPLAQIPGEPECLFIVFEMKEGDSRIKLAMHLASTD